MNQTIYEVELQTLVFGGDALGRLPDGRAVFVPFGLPGEKVRVSLVEDKPRHARAEIIEIKQSSQQRTTPRCVHFGECGGCHYQHLTYANQLAVKAAILRDQFRRIGDMQDIPLQPPVASPREWHYRNTVQFHLTDNGEPGYHRAGSQEVFAIRECFLPEILLNDLRSQLTFESNPSLQHIELRAGTDDEIMLVLESDDMMAPELTVEGLPLSVVHLSPAGKIVMAGSDHITMKIAENRFRVSAESFFQVNSGMAQLIVEHILQSLPFTGSETVLDVYCGVGLFSAFVAPRVSRLIGIEASPSACDDFTVNLDAFDNVELYQDAAENALPQLDVHPEIVIVDPPRAGMAKTALEGLLHLKPQKIVYISCDPATLARDSRLIFDGGYRLLQITPFDMFPHTCHIESVSYWENTKKSL